MSKFDDYCNELLGEKSVVVKKRTFYPRKITKAGGFSPEFKKALSKEISRLQSVDQSIKNNDILKAIKFDLQH